VPLKVGKDLLNVANTILGPKTELLRGPAMFLIPKFIRMYRLPTRLAAFASDHGLPQERFYNLMCLAFGDNSQKFADFVSFLLRMNTKR
jgi:hypothetical protein